MVMTVDDVQVGQEFTVRTKTTWRGERKVGFMLIGPDGKPTGPVLYTFPDALDRASVRIGTVPEPVTPPSRKALKEVYPRTEKVQTVPTTPVVPATTQDKWAAIMEGLGG